MNSGRKAQCILVKSDEFENSYSLLYILLKILLMLLPARSARRWCNLDGLKRSFRIISRAVYKLNRSRLSLFYCKHHLTLRRGSWKVGGIPIIFPSPFFFQIPLSSARIPFQSQLLSLYIPVIPVCTGLASSLKFFRAWSVRLCSVFQERCLPLRHSHCHCRCVTVTVTVTVLFTGIFPGG